MRATNIKFTETFVSLEETQALREGSRRLLPALYGSRPSPLNGDSLHGHLTAFVNANDTAASAPSAR